MAKTTFEDDLNNRVAKAREKVRQKVAPLEAPPPTDGTDIVVENAGVLPLDTSDTPVVPEIPPAPEAVIEAAPPPPEVPPPAAEKPAEPPAPPVEVKPAEPDIKPDVERYRAERESRRQIRKLEKEIAALQARQAQAPVVQPPEQMATTPETTDNDPFGFEAARQRTIAEVNAKLAENKRDLEQQKQLLAQEQARLALQQEEAQFAVQHPDYAQARDHLLNWERQRYLKSGAATAQSLRMRQAAEWQVANHPDPQERQRAQEYIEKVEAYADDKGISDADAWVTAATDTWVENLRAQVIEGARARRESVAQNAWNLAVEYAGYQPKETVTGAPTAAKIPEVVDSGPPISPAERIRQQAKAAAAGKSLSAASASTPSPTQPTIQTLQQWMAWRQKDPAGARQWMEAQNRVNPNWYRDLAG